MIKNRTTETIVYGPVQSRRFGRSLGINISGFSKFCSFNCIYCFRGFNEGAIEEGTKIFPDFQTVRKDFEKYMKKNDLSQLEDITVAGNGEPTDNRALPEIIDYLFSLKQTKLKHIKISLLTNGMGFVPRINPDYEALLARTSKVDRLCIKLDSGNPDTWKRIANPCYNIEFEEWFDSLTKIDKLNIQTMFMNGRIDNTTDEELEKLIECYNKLNAGLIYLITLDKPPADHRIIPVPEEKMLYIEKTMSSKSKNSFYLPK